MKIAFVTTAAAALLFAFAPCPVARGQDPGGEQRGGQDEKDKPEDSPPKAEDRTKWPELKAVRASMAKDNIPYLAGKDARKRESARKMLLKWGPGVCPVLLEAMTTRAKDELVDEIARLLDALIQPEHAWALAQHIDQRNERRDLWILDKLIAFKNRELLPVFKEATKSKSAKTATKAWYAVAAHGDVDALPFLLERTRAAWDDENYDIRSALPALKGKKATDWLMAKLRDGDTHEKIAALRLLGGAGTKDAVSAIGSLLDSKEHQLRAGAVNALRGIVDGEPPFRNLSVFQAIEEVKKWKGRIGRR